MSPKASSLAVDERKDQEAEAAFEPKLSILVKSRNGMIKCPVSIDDSVIKIGGRITISF